MSQAQYAVLDVIKTLLHASPCSGTGKITVNKKKMLKSTSHTDLRLVINQPFAVTSTVGSYDVFVNVVGGGYAGQAELSVTVSLVPFFK